VEADSPEEVLPLRISYHPGPYLSSSHAIFPCLAPPARRHYNHPEDNGPFFSVTVACLT